MRLPGVLIAVASCGVLMLLLFVTGVMSVPAMALLTLLLWNACCCRLEHDRRYG